MNDTIATIEALEMVLDEAIEEYKKSISRNRRISRLERIYEIERKVERAKALYYVERIRL